MKIINATTPADFSECALEEGLRQLKNKNKNKIFLLLSINYKFFDVYKIIGGKIKFPYTNVDTSGILEDDSWLLIDRLNKKMYYNEGA
jgi:hypothetical protein